ncbi:hypothetical protein [Vibrio crassostreae]|uniref:hypothetical protein n=1 Tax=Vibrio crassostreae TaxID=246167 RepID=UPI001B3050DB|nr:hypothetical protein [Vibrio crassostreae]
MDIQDLQKLLVEKTELNAVETFDISPVVSIELNEVIASNESRYASQNSCYTNAANLVLDSVMDEDLEYVLVFGIRKDRPDVVEASKVCPDVQPHIIPLAEDTYAFGHALVYNYMDDEFYDPTLQSAYFGLADHYFLVKRFEEEELVHYLKQNELIPPMLVLNKSCDR